MQSVNGGVEPIVAVYHSVIDHLFKVEGQVDKIAQMVETLQRYKPRPAQFYSD